jgi:hypothetical protein
MSAVSYIASDSIMSVTYNSVNKQSDVNKKVYARICLS